MVRGVRLTLLALVGCGRVAFDASPPPDGQTCPDPVVPPPDAPSGQAHYVAPSGGSDANPGSAAAPWATIAYALTVAAPDETIVLQDGLYTEALTVNVDGMRIRAATDGGAIFDGGGATTPCLIMGVGITVEGVHCRNGFPSAFAVLDSANVTVRRVTAHTAVSRTVFRVQRASNTLLEDVASWGSAANNYMIADSTNVTLRRCWGRWDAGVDPYNSIVALVDGTTDSLVENCVLVSTVPYDVSRSVVGLNLYSRDQALDRNRLVGNVVHGMPDWAAVVSTELSRIAGNRFIDNVLMASGAGLYQRSDADFGVERLTSVELFGNGAFVIDAHSAEPKASNFEIAGYVRDSVLGVAPYGLFVFSDYLTSFTHTNNTLFQVGEPYRGAVNPDATETIVDPAYDTAKYGRGAYLIRNGLGTGAEVLNRYVDGVLTSEPLWPWPMEDRISREAGSSVTYESGGGIWRVLPDSPCPSP